MTTATELTLLGTEELEGRLAESRRELFNLRFSCDRPAGQHGAHRPRPPRGGPAS